MRREHRDVKGRRSPPLVRDIAAITHYSGGRSAGETLAKPGQRSSRLTVYSAFFSIGVHDGRGGLVARRCKMTSRTMVGSRRTRLSEAPGPGVDGRASTTNSRRSIIHSYRDDPPGPVAAGNK